MQHNMHNMSNNTIKWAQRDATKWANVFFVENL